MKKVTIFTANLNYGGISKSVCSLANVLCERYNVEIISVYKLTEKPVFNIDDKVSIKYLIEDIKKDSNSNCLKKIINKNKLLKLENKMVTEAIKECKSNIIISTAVAFNTLLGKYGSKKSYKIGWEHNHHHLKVDNINKLVASTKDLDKVVFVSNYLTKWYTREYKVRRMALKAIYIPNFIDGIPPLKSKLNKNNFISVGRIYKEKGFIDLVKVFKVMHDFNNSVHLDIIGDGNEFEKVNKLIKVHKLEKAITLHGFKDEKYVAKMYQNSTIYLMTSYTESFGLTLIEAMSYGLPCIAFSSAEGAIELIEEGYNGYLINNRSIDEMARVALGLLENKEKLSKTSAGALETAQKYGKDIVKQQWFDLLEKK